MKLLFCRHCGDVVKLQRTIRRCKCRAVSGKYLPDGAHAVVSKDALVIGLANPDVVSATGVFLSNHPDAGYRTVRAWVMGKDAPRVHWENE